MHHFPCRRRHRTCTDCHGSLGVDMMLTIPRYVCACIVKIESDTGNISVQVRYLHIIKSTCQSSPRNKQTNNNIYIIGSHKRSPPNKQTNINIYIIGCHKRSPRNKQTNNNIYSVLSWLTYINTIINIFVTYILVL